MSEQRQSSNGVIDLGPTTQKPLHDLKAYDHDVVILEWRHNGVEGVVCVPYEVFQRYPAPMARTIQRVEEGFRELNPRPTGELTYA